MELELIPFLLLIFLVGFLFYSKYDDFKNWESIDESSGIHVNEVQAKFSLLKGNNIRCRIKSTTSIANRGGGSGTVTSVRLEVHKEDIQRANELLRNNHR